MQAVVAPTSGDESVLVFEERPKPHPEAHEVCIRVVATALNRADVLQRQGHYPPPPGVTDILGLECSGVVSQVGSQVHQFSPGDRVCALLAGGGYAEEVAVPATQVLPLDDHISFTTGAALPEGLCTVWSNLVSVGQLSEGHTALIHGGAGGIGTFALQVARTLGASVITTVGSENKAQLCQSLGADHTINYRQESFGERVAEITQGRGVDVILDIMGAKYLADNVRSLATGGRLVVIGLQGGVKADLNLAALLMKQATISGTSLRASTLTHKAQIVADVHKHLWPHLADGSLKVHIDHVLPWTHVQQAHRLMQDSSRSGKIVLTVDPELND